MQAVPACFHSTPTARGEICHYCCKRVVCRQNEKQVKQPCTSLGKKEETQPGGLRVEPTLHRYLLDTRSRNTQRSCSPKLIPVSPIGDTGVKYPPCAIQLLSLRLYSSISGFHFILSESKSENCWFHGMLRAGMLLPQCCHSWTALVLLPQIKSQPAFSLPASRETWDFSQQHFVHRGPKQT